MHIISLCFGIKQFHTMTPALKLNEDERKPLLSCILKFFIRGNNLTIVSTNMTRAPMTHALQGQSCYSRCRRGYVPMALRAVRIQPRVSLSTAIAPSLQLDLALV
ncbi:hypothetical protein MRB53_038798 [Persea americana]|nr:hypothetical protein MRB53_038798 [Persea americana]